MEENKKPKKISEMELEESIDYLKAKLKEKEDHKKALRKKRQYQMKELNRKKNLVKDTEKLQRMLEKGYSPATMSNNLVSGHLSKKAEEKVKKIIEWMGSGISRIKLLDKIQEEFKLAKGSAVNYLHASYSYLKEMSDEEREFLRDKHKAMLENLWQQNVERGDLREAHNILITINKMYGVNEPEKTEHNSTIFEFKFNTAPTPPPANAVNNITPNIEVQDVDYFEESKSDNDGEDDDDIEDLTEEEDE